MKISKNRGFTLVEMLVVIAIIAILTGIIMTNLVGSKAKSRDAKRASDLAQIQLAIEQFFDRCGQYPSSLDTSAGGVGICPDDANGSPITLGNFISVIPVDPSSGDAYDYVTNHDSISQNYLQPTDYVLHTTFETTNSVSAQSVTTNLPLWFVYFGGGNSPQKYPCDLTTNYCVRPN